MLYHSWPAIHASFEDPSVRNRFFQGLEVQLSRQKKKKLFCACCCNSRNWCLLEVWSHVSMLCLFYPELCIYVFLKKKRHGTGKLMST